MTPVRTRRGKLIHITHDARLTLCGRRLKQQIIEPDAQPTCELCVLAMTTN